MVQMLFYYHIIAALTTGLAALFLYRWKDSISELITLVLGILILFGLALTALFFPVEGFARTQLLAWVAFLYFPLFLLIGITNFWNQNRKLAVVLAVTLLVMLVVAADSFLIEPRWLKVTRMEISSPKLDQNLTLAVLADIQTDSPGNYEKKALEIVRENNPDLILLAGDYIQVRDMDDYLREGEVLNQIFHEVDLSSDLGIYAVRGNVDWNSWSDIFQGLEIKTFEETETIDLGPVLLTGLSWTDSRDPTFQVAGDDKFHIVLGHYPDFSLGKIDGDLLLAGHTHGGQIRLPGVGPLLINSLIPKNWASGLTEIQPGKYLLVSNGIGLERGYAPRMRFLCRPEVIILQLEPTVQD
jgi:predicted MPP superfamily phosphohydrolase